MFLIDELSHAEKAEAALKNREKVAKKFNQFFFPLITTCLRRDVIVLCVQMMRKLEANTKEDGDEFLHNSK